MSAFTLHDLERRIAARADASPESSYTRKLLDRGAPGCAKKFGEEAVELVLAAAGEPAPRVIEEAADVLYHMLVVLKARDVKLAQVEAVLDARTARSGLAEKASRTVSAPDA